MNQFYNNQYNKDAIDFFNEVAQKTLDSSIALLEQNIEFAKESAQRNLSHAVSLCQAGSAEEALDYQRKAGQAEFSELKKAGEAYYELFDNANREFVSVAQRGRGLVENSFNEAAGQVSSVLPNGKGFETFQTSAKAAGDLLQKSMDIAMQVSRAGADSIVKGQQAVAKAQVVANGSKRKTVKK